MAHDTTRTGPQGSRSVLVASVPFASTDLAAATDWLTMSAMNGEPVTARLSNAYCVAVAQRDQQYMELFTSSPGVNFPDGTPIVWFMRRASRASGGTVPQRVRGPSLFAAALEAHADAGLRTFLLGASRPTLDSLILNLQQRFPSLMVCGSFSPPFQPLSDSYIELCVDAIRGSGAQIVWVGLGTPKQDFVAKEIARRLEIPAVGVGAAFDFAAGTVREAPLLIQNSGLEWLFRLISEPRRLWRRYLIGNVAFLAAAFRGAARSRRVMAESSG